MTKKEAEAVFYLFIIGAIVTGVAKFFETVGFVAPIAVLVGCVLLYCAHNTNKKKERLSYLKEKYKDDEIVQKIFDGYFWQDQTAEQLIDSLGAPVEIDNNVLKTKKKEIWKYEHQGGNRFNLRITLENDVVIGWDQKG